MICRFLLCRQFDQFLGLRGVEVNGFSTKTCLPFSSAALANSKCVHTGVITATASMSGDGTTSAESLVTRMPGIGRSAALQRGRILVADRGQLAAVRGLKVAGHHRAPVAVTDYSNSNHASSSLHSAAGTNARRWP